MSIEHKHAVAWEQNERMPSGSTNGAYDELRPDRPTEQGLVYIKDGQLVVSCEDPYYNGVFSKENVLKLIRLCATVLAPDHEGKIAEFETGRKTGCGNSLAALQEDGSLELMCEDGYYNGCMSPAEAFNLAVKILDEG